MLPRADVVTVHARSASVIIGEPEISLMRRGSYLINTARATVLDYEALVQALHDGHLRGAALDVYPEEPLPRTSPLLSAPGLTLTPHLAGATEEVSGRMYDIALQALNDVYHEPDWTGVAVRNRQVQRAWTHALAAGRIPPSPAQLGRWAMTVKIAVIGGGSSMFVPGLVRRLVDLPCFEGAELRLMDIDEARLATMQVLSSHLAGSSGQQLKVVATTNQREAARGRGLRHRRDQRRRNGSLGI